MLSSKAHFDVVPAAAVLGLLLYLRLMSSLLHEAMAIAATISSARS